MLYISTTFLITVLVIVVNEGEAVRPHFRDQLAQETRSALTIVEGPKYVAPLAQRPPAKPPKPTPDKHANHNYVDKSRLLPYAPNVQKIPLKNYRVHPSYLPPNPLYKYPKVIPLSNHQRLPHYPPHRNHLMFSASTGKPIVVSPKSPKFSLPVQTINGIRSYDVKPPKTKDTTTTTTTTTTEKPKRNKRIWPKHILDKMNVTVTPNSTLNDTTITQVALANKTKISNDTDYETSSSVHIHVRHVKPLSVSSTTEATTRRYRPVVRVPKHRSTTTASPNVTFPTNDWIPIVPSHYPKTRRTVLKQRRSDNDYELLTPAEDRRMLYLHPYGLIHLNKPNRPRVGPKKMQFLRKKKRQTKPNVHSGFSGHMVARPSHTHVVWRDADHEAGHRGVVTKVKHHHHHHHHKYVKTVEKPVHVPVKVEVPKPYPVPVEKKVPYPVEKIVNKVVEKKVPYPVTVEKKVPYPVQVKVPQLFPIKVVEKEYVPKPYPIVHHVPVIKYVEVKVPQPVTVEKKVPYPVHVKVNVPVDRPVPVPVPVEKKVHVPVPYKVFVPQPYPVEKRVPYPVEVKVREPVEVIKHVHVPVKVPVPHPVPVKVPHPVPVTVEKKVPYPVEVEKKVPIPVKVYVPRPVTVEKRVPVYISNPYPVEKVPISEKKTIPYYDYFSTPGSLSHLPSPTSLETLLGTGLTVSDLGVTQNPHHTVTVHGNGHFTGFSDRSDGTTPPPATDKS